MPNEKSMEDQHLISILNRITNAKRVYRDKAANDILDNPHLIPKLITKIYDIEDPLHIKAAWVFELVCVEDIRLLNPYIHDFISGMSALSHESSLRPVSKICSLWCAYYFAGHTEKVFLSKEDKEQIISCNFDWLIEEHKVATQVFAMDTLKLWGSEEDWIHQELRSVLEKNTDSGSKGYKAHASKLLKNL